VLKSLGLAGIETLTPFGLRSYPFAGAALEVSRTGYTGDLGYELWIDPERALPLWDALFAAGADHGIRAIGTLALEMSRIEAGFIQAGVDFLPADRAVRVDRTRSPFELDLGRLVDFGKPNFTGRRALLEEQRRGSRFRLVRLDVEGNKPAKDAYVYDSRRTNIGVVTSSMWSPAAKASIALASVKMPWGVPGEELSAEIYYQKELKWNRFMARCRVIEGPFFDPPRRRATPAADR
jgi:aminomethyltransferase